MLVSGGRKLFYYTFPTENRHLYEIDFLITSKSKIVPIEVKSSGYRTHKSLDEFLLKYPSKTIDPLIVYTKDFQKEGTITYIPMYMLPFYLEKSKK